MADPLVHKSFLRPSTQSARRAAAAVRGPAHRHRARHCSVGIARSTRTRPTGIMASDRVALMETIGGCTVMRASVATEAVRVGPSEISGAYVVEVGLFPPGQPGPPLHFHPHTDEMFYIADGDATFQLGDSELQLSAGALVIVPRGRRTHGVELGGPSRARSHRDFARRRRARIRSRRNRLAARRRTWGRSARFDPNATPRALARCVGERPDSECCYARIPQAASLARDTPVHRPTREHRASRSRSCSCVKVAAHLRGSGSSARYR